VRHIGVTRRGFAATVFSGSLTESSLSSSAKSVGAWAWCGATRGLPPSLGIKQDLAKDRAMTTFLFRPSRWKAGLLLLLMAGLSVSALWVAQLPDLRLYERVCGYAAAAIFGWGLAIAARRVMMTGPAIEVSDWGIRDFRQHIEAPWAKIKRVSVWWEELDAARTPWIALDIDDPESVFTNQDHLARSARMMNRVRMRPEVALNTMGLPGAYRRVLAAIETARPDLIRQ
jgi:hypothetical protein